MRGKQIYKTCTQVLAVFHTFSFHHFFLELCLIQSVHNDTQECESGLMTLALGQKEPAELPWEKKKSTKRMLSIQRDNTHVGQHFVPSLT